MEGEQMKKIIAVVLSFALLISTFAFAQYGIDAKTKSGFYSASMQKKKSPFGYLKKVKIVDNVVKVKKPIKQNNVQTTTQAGEQATAAPQTTKQQYKTVKKRKGLQKIITYGAFDYRKRDKGSSNLLKAKKRTFIVSKKCKFYDKAWTKGQKKIKRAAAFKKLKKLKKKTWDYCEFRVKNGKLVCIKFGK